MREQDTREPRGLDPAIVKDFEAYIQRLPAKERNQLSKTSLTLFENANGQQAVCFEIGRPGFLGENIYAHVLVYDQKNKRIKVMKYKSRESMS